MSKKRADQLIQQFYPQFSRSKIQTLIQKKKILVKINDQPQLIKKASDPFDSEIITKEHFEFLPDEELEFVSRGALKLKKALDKFEINLENKICMDVGLSTGGFSDIMLKRGALKVLGIDVGKEQLHQSLKSNEKLMAFDKVNARYPIDEDILNQFFSESAKEFDFIAIDVSFISLSLIIPNIIKYLKQISVLVCLVKPQFELSRGDLNNKGVVKDPQKALSVLEKTIELLKDNGIKQLKHCESPIEGDNGNKEFLIASFLSN